LVILLFGTSHFVRATVTYRRAGEGFFFYNYKDGEDWYVNFDNERRNRWGDYSATFIDPEDDVTGMDYTGVCPAKS
jgi:hypothetical protein